MRKSAFAFTLIVGALVLTALVFVPISSQAQTVHAVGNTATGITGVWCGDVLYDVEFVYLTGYQVYGADPPDFPFKGASGSLDSSAEEATLGCSVYIQQILNEWSPVVTRVGPNNSSYFYIAAGEEEGEGEGGSEGLAAWGGFESKYYENVEGINRPPHQWVLADNWCFFECPEEKELGPFGAVGIDPDDVNSYAKLTYHDGEPPAAEESVGGLVSEGGGVTGLTGSGLVLQNNSADDLSISQNGDFTFNTPLAPNDPYSVTVKTQPSGQFCHIARGSGSVPAGGVDDVLVTCGDPPVSEDRMPHLPAITLLLLSR